MYLFFLIYACTVQQWCIDNIGMLCFLRLKLQRTTIKFYYKQRNTTYLIKEIVDNFNVDVNRCLCRNIQVCIYFDSRAPL